MSRGSGFKDGVRRKLARWFGFCCFFFSCHREMSDLIPHRWLRGWLVVLMTVFGFRKKNLTNWRGREAKSTVLSVGLALVYYHSSLRQTLFIHSHGVPAFSVPLHRR